MRNKVRYTRMAQQREKQILEQVGVLVHERDARLVNLSHNAKMMRKRLREERETTHHARMAARVTLERLVKHEEMCIMDAYLHKLEFFLLEHRDALLADSEHVAYLLQQVRDGAEMLHAYASKVPSGTLPDMTALSLHAYATPDALMEKCPHLAHE